MPVQSFVDYTQGIPFGGSSVTGAAATAATITLAAVQSQSNVIQSLTLSYSGAASGAVTVTVADGATPVWVIDQNLALSTPWTVIFPGAGLAGSVGNAVTVTVSAGAASSIAKLSVVTGKF